MHRSRIAVVLIDHPEETYDPAAAFWAGAQGAERSVNDDPGEVSRLEALGADDFERHATTWTTS